MEEISSKGIDNLRAHWPKCTYVSTCPLVGANSGYSGDQEAFQVGGQKVLWACQSLSERSSISEVKDALLLG